MNRNNQKEIKNKITRNTKKIFFYAAIFSCFASSAFAIGSGFKFLEKTAIRMRNFSLVTPISNLTDRNSLFTTDLQQFQREKMHLDVRNAKTLYFQEEGLSIFIATTIIPSDTLPSIEEKTNVAEEILNAQYLLNFINKKYIIEVFNKSINNKISGRTEDLSAVTTYVSKLIFSAPPLLQIGYPAVSSSLEELRLRLENSERIKDITIKTKDNHMLSLVGQHGCGCGTL